MAERTENRMTKKRNEKVLQRRESARGLCVCARVIEVDDECEPSYLYLYLCLYLHLSPRLHEPILRS